ncbi:MAG: Asp-tRNA(Asn)/Glu-tRNA(Gln) amidotransferase GatCAB subunit C [Erysipelothrix sp.]|nr:Asp-tRNA(Asn)/Glu-tRNA(Gln) amidotransferase GatCAB subunit C [Erysipelothrix sp.]
MNIKESAHKIYLDFTAEESEEVLKQIKILNEEVDFLNTIDTEHVEAMELPFTLNENELRMDTEGDVLSLEDLLSNAPDASENFVRIVKVVG